DTDGGVAKVKLTAPLLVGSGTITASIAGKSATKPITYTPEAPEVVSSPGAAQINIHFFGVVTQETAKKNSAIAQVIIFNFVIALSIKFKLQIYIFF
ncbi:MAG: hypothetical protein R6W78_15750, partial [Bacteroidales bacterium]